jgi:predicted alpha/beta superfamily hydrolase
MGTAATQENVQPHQANNALCVEMTTPVDDKRPVYIVGNFNNWTVDESRFRLTRVSPGKFNFTFPADVQLQQHTTYKYVRGGWENQELDTFGSKIANRVLDNPHGTVYDFVPRWSNYGLDFNPAFFPKVKIISEAFDIPQLNKKRKVTILLPYNYEKQLQKRYPVLYLQDGQNLFNPHSPYGNWAIDQKLAVLAEKGVGDVIVVAVDHGGAERINEFLPVKHTRLGTDEGKKYVRFMAETLKPYIDTHFRTLADRANTGIGGSSLGGLITLFAGLMYPKHFGKLMIFSPSLWVTRNVPFDTIQFFQPIPTKIYVYAGGKEGNSMIPNVKNFRDSLKTQGFDSSAIHFKMSIDPNGEHSEMRWGQEFPRAVEWLFHH